MIDNCDVKALSQKFIKKGFKHQLIKREGDVALYKRSSVEFSKSVHYEVVIITSHNGITINGNYIEPGELYPSSSQWGDKGWTFTTLEAAEEGFKITLKKQKIAAVRKSQKDQKKNK